MMTAQEIQELLARQRAFFKADALWRSIFVWRN